ncbi:hypothetical protein B0H14DRAFT_3773410 [Mycena olivaceomarginata]|nr:hypothetical protein B0H14DRAFT_3773410 [Mycena olivaceomarginata]
MLSQRVKTTTWWRRSGPSQRVNLIFMPSAASALSSSAGKSLGPRCRFRDSDFIRQIHRHEIPDGQRLAAFPAKFGWGWGEHEYLSVSSWHVRDGRGRAILGMHAKLRQNGHRLKRKLRLRSGRGAHLNARHPAVDWQFLVGCRTADVSRRKKGPRDSTWKIAETPVFAQNTGQSTDREPDSNDC